MHLRAVLGVTFLALTAISFVVAHAVFSVIDSDTEQIAPPLQLCDPSIASPSLKSSQITTIKLCAWRSIHGTVLDEILDVDPSSSQERVMGKQLESPTIDVRTYETKSQFRDSEGECVTSIPTGADLSLCLKEDGNTSFLESVKSVRYENEA